MAPPIPKQVKDMTGQRFGRLTVGEFGGVGSYGAMWVCRCDCGNVRTIAGANLTRGHSASCGCYCTERKRESVRTHGCYRRPEYQLWKGMIKRCESPHATHYDDYGGRGISVCQRWHDIHHFISDMGPRPSPRHTIDRINNDGNYEPANCRWILSEDQANNRRGNVIVTHAGETMTASQWARRLGMKNQTILNRLRKGWTPERALGPLTRKPRKQANIRGR